MRDKLPVSKITFHCCWEETPQHQLSPLVWRDRIEWQFKKIACITIKRQCNLCAVRKGCIVAFLFTPEFWFEGKLQHPLGSLPLPWVPRYPADSVSPDFLLEITLVGKKAIGLLPYWFVAVDRLGKTKKPQFAVQSVSSQTEEGERLLYDAAGSSLYTDPGFTVPKTFSGVKRIRLDIQTPMRLFERKRPLLNPSFGHIVMSIARRAETLALCYGEEPVSIDGCWREADQSIITTAALHWQEQVAFSKRQKETVSLGGLMGSLEFEGNMEPFGELLGMGELIGVGKGTALGLGRFALSS
ncbi:MAG: CRISPR system precrRNA processing endoribonuclease RAMP protein Cas6 [Desulfobacterota bacterium]|nr:CRISPR system precrRNA processing endoribonuclease RAMP protein Cas6 [Thermodesulfobacteriota bacterium]